MTAIADAAPQAGLVARQRKLSANLPQDFYNQVWCSSIYSWSEQAAAEIERLTAALAEQRRMYLWEIGTVFGCAGFAEEHTYAETFRKVAADHRESYDAGLRILRERAEKAEARATEAERERDALKEYSSHLEWCRSCAEDSVGSCAEGTALRDAARQAGRGLSGEKDAG